MQRLSQKLNFEPDAENLPDGFSQEIYDISRAINDPEKAKEIFQRLQPVLKTYCADQTLAVACGLLLEKQRNEEGMRDVWEDLNGLFPKDATALRMLMRWYRRDQQTQTGIDHIHQLFPQAHHSLTEASQAVLGLSELKAWDEIDNIMSSVLVLHSKDRPIRMAYIKILNEQCRYADAAKVAAHVEEREKMGDASQNLLNSVTAHASVLEKYGRTDTADLITDILLRAPVPRVYDGPKKVVFFTGQLGTGGAERQMTRIACAYKERHTADDPFGIDPQVWVKHANPATGANFYLPKLQDEGVETVVMSGMAEIPVNNLDGLSDDIKEMLNLLAPDVRRHTGLLYRMFSENQTDVAYLWQDGGIVQSAIAAALAGVPKIITSFRGLPPNLRKNFMRDELPVLYKALACMQNVAFTANSAATAAEYEKWLDLPRGKVQVIPNATPPVLPDGDETDQALWSDILSASEDCDKTVLGVFRFDNNKRPKEWIDAASRYLQNRNDTRFIMLGDGYLRDDCVQIVKDRGLENRIFLTGIRKNVGFYMHRADLLMHLAQMEGLPNVLIEAQLAGTPVLATPAGGTDEVVEHGITGLILSNADELPIRELDIGLDGLLSEPAITAKLGAAALVNSGERFSVETILKRTRELFDKTGT